MMRAVKGKCGLTHGRGMSESVRMIWVKTMHTCSTLYSAISNLTNHHQPFDEIPHHAARRSQARRYFDDITKLVEWFEENDPFNTTDTRWHSLRSRVASTENDGINCDYAEEVGSSLMCKMAALFCIDVVVKKAGKVKLLHR